MASDCGTRRLFHPAEKTIGRKTENHRGHSSNGAYMEFTYSARADRGCRREIRNSNNGVFARLGNQGQPSYRTCPAGRNSPAGFLAIFGHGSVCTQPTTAGSFASLAPILLEFTELLNARDVTALQTLHAVLAPQFAWGSHDSRKSEPDVWWRQ